MNYIIRQYKDSDLDQLLSCWENASRLAHPFLTDEFMDSERHNIPNIYLPNADTWVVEHNDSVIGFIALIGNEIGAIFVQPEYHGKGIGWTLMNKAKELCGDLEVEVFEDNVIGRKFYAKYGFKPLRQYVHEETGHIMLRLKYSFKND